MFRHSCRTLLTSHLNQHLRRRSSKTVPGSLIEIDLSSGATTINGNDHPEDDGCDAPLDKATIISQLEDALSYLALLRSIPIWLPFLPGFSFWVPPDRRPLSVPEFVDEWSNRLSHEESHSLATCRGFPSSYYYLSDTASESRDPKTSLAVTVVNMNPTSDTNFVTWARGGLAYIEQDEKDEIGAIRDIKSEDQSSE